MFQLAYKTYDHIPYKIISCIFSTERFPVLCDKWKAVNFDIMDEVNNDVKGAIIERQSLVSLEHIENYRIHSVIRLSF